MTEPRRIRVDLPAGAPAGYEVLVGPGLLARLPSLLTSHAPAVRYAIVSDRAVAALYGRELARAFTGRGLRCELFDFAPGEASKTRETWSMLTDALLAAGCGRDAAVIALGGGVTCDLAGFVAATFMRGIPVVQAPTSLLAMVDAAIGGKTGVDTPAGKNLVGAFHQPRLVVADTETLRTLPQAELMVGLAECVKHAAIADADHLGWIRDSAPAILDRADAALTTLLHRSMEIKARIVAADILEAGPRAALNFGHTIAHALEAAASFRIPHGHAVAVGMLAEALAGEAVGITEPGTAAELEAGLAALGLPRRLGLDVSTDEVMKRVRTDKKAREGRTRYTLLLRAGALARGTAGEWTHPLEEGTVRDALGRLRS